MAAIIVVLSLTSSQRSNSVPGPGQKVLGDQVAKGQSTTASEVLSRDGRIFMVEWSNGGHS